MKKASYIAFIFTLTFSKASYISFIFSLTYSKVVNIEGCIVIHLHCLSWHSPEPVKILFEKGSEYLRPEGSKAWRHTIWVSVAAPQLVLAWHKHFTHSPLALGFLRVKGLSGDKKSEVLSYSKSLMYFRQISFSNL